MKIAVDIEIVKPIHNWKFAINRFIIEFEERLVSYL
jgi:phosphopantetheinyl transferase